jgi:hypothetical protein
MGGLGTSDVFGVEGGHGDEIFRSGQPRDSFVAEKEDVTTFRFAVITIFGPIRVCVASELIIAANAAAAKMQSKVGGELEVLENSFGSRERAA